MISSVHKVDSQKLSVFCKETAEYYVKLYGWHPMAPIMHKLLAHAPAIIEHAIVPILLDNLSEETTEARNDHFRKYRHATLMYLIDCY